MAEPDFHTVLCLHHRLEHYTLLLGTEHTFDQVCFGKTLAVHHVELHQGLETLAEVLLHHLQTAGFGKDLQQLVIGEEVKPREDLALAFQVLLQFLFDLLQRFHCLVEFLKQIGHFGQLDDLGTAQ
jgi:hypothetical protein